ncbi:hypothetical protein TSACC_22125 [Terrimicrobium sacchariphilum]|uniref:DUF1275 domain-containing protein n=1 Tax=Terrimicrobium sacchariphilum TaxID=690879 RepID=A0A146GAS8_TERSA|nr:DUF1275 family protein [Terrimicrobium sacchariphilum]GAT33708.1 hypothetical protein TSACC_22125 [Terrimicrobium sacchariphilum]
MTAAAPQTRAGFSETCLLASVGGSVDAIGVITLGGLFVSHMSGNTAAQGVFFGQGQWWLAWPHLVAVPIFLLGLFLGYLLMERAPTPRQCAGVLVLEAGLLFVFFILLLMGADYRVENPWTFLTAVPPLIAMGIQNATLRGLKLSAFPSTYVTGVLDTVGRTFAKAIAGKAEERAENALMARRAAMVWTSYALGAIAGSAIFLGIGKWVVLFPITSLLAVAWSVARR